MDGPSDILFAALLFVGLFFNWVKALVCAAIAVLVRNGNAGALLAAVVGAIEGLLGSRLELLDLYWTGNGWAALDGLAALQVAMSALASIVWWSFARGLYALVRHLTRSAQAS